MTVSDAKLSAGVLSEFSKAWSSAVKAYDQGMINSERCLQSYLYSYMLRAYENCDSFRIYIEARLNKSSGDEKNSKNSFIDTVFVIDNIIRLAVEIKFRSGGAPSAGSVQKDIATLSHLLNKETSILLRRIHGDELRLYTNANTLVAYALFHSSARDFAVDHDFINKYRPAKEHDPNPDWLLKGGGWRQRTLPHRFYIFSAKTAKKTDDEKKSSEIFVMHNPKCQEWGAFNSCNL